MKHVQIENIEKAIEKVDNLHEDDLEILAEKHALSKPILLSYIMSAAIEYENEELEGLIIYYFCLLCEAFEFQGLKTSDVSEEQIDEFQEPYFEALDSYFESNDDEVLDDFCDQPILTQFIAIEISTEDEDGTTLDDETASQLFIVLCALVTLLNKSIA
jgi:hypothetical protein